MAKKDDLKAGVQGAIKGFVSRIPGFGEMIAGYDAYQTASFQRETRAFLRSLEHVLAREDAKFDPSWYSTPEGEQFARKVLDCAVDAQLSDKKELFAAAFVSGAREDIGSSLEKLLFVDILRQMSRASLVVLAEIHSSLSSKVHGPARTPPANESFPLIDSKRIAESLSGKHDPYLVEAAIREIESHGLFSSTAVWNKQPDGSSRPGGGFASELAYTDFTFRFVDFLGLRPE